MRNGFIKLAENLFHADIISDPSSYKQPLSTRLALEGWRILRIINKPFIGEEERGSPKTSVFPGSSLVTRSLAIWLLDASSETIRS